jgi:hypothetical protein
MPVSMPVMPGLFASLTVSEWVPSVFSVATNAWAALSEAVNL